MADQTLARKFLEAFDPQLLNIIDRMPHDTSKRYWDDIADRVQVFIHDIERKHGQAISDKIDTELRRPPVWGPCVHGDMMLDMSEEDYNAQLDRIARFAMHIPEPPRTPRKRSD